MNRAAEATAVAAAPNGGFTKVIQPTHGWRPINWREILAYKDLLFFLVRRDVKARHAQAIIGFGWAIIRPFSTSTLKASPSLNLADSRPVESYILTDLRRR
jgi:hypothetical protein